MQRVGTCFVDDMFFICFSYVFHMSSFFLLCVSRSKASQAEAESVFARASHLDTLEARDLTELTAPHPDPSLNHCRSCGLLEVVGKTAFFVGKEGLVDSKVLPMHQAPGPADVEPSSSRSRLKPLVV